MKTPTLKEVKKYFKNAKEVRCLASDKIVKIDLTSKIKFILNAYWVQGTNEYGSICLLDLDKPKGYAEIISYKEKQPTMKNYKKIDHFEPIAMKCTQEQFEEIKLILERFKLVTSIESCFKESPYLVNNFASNKGYEITNLWSSNKHNAGRKVHETFNAKTFLKACGIVKKQSKVKITTELLKQLEDNNSYSEELIKKEFPQLFESDKLKVGKWYKCLDMGNIIYYNSNNQDNYGLSYYKKEWANDLFFQKAYKYELATPQEVETALINEAKKRGFVYGAEYKNTYSSTGKVKNNCWHFDFKYNRLSQKGNVGSGNLHYIFDNGKWVAEISEAMKSETILN